MKTVYFSKAPHAYPTRSSGFDGEEGYIPAGRGRSRRLTAGKVTRRDASGHVIGVTCELRAIPAGKRLAGIPVVKLSAKARADWRAIGQARTFANVATVEHATKEHL